MNLLRKMLIKTITLLMLSLIAFDASKATALAGKYAYVKNTKAKYALAPDFKLKDLNGKNVSLSSFRGKKNVYLNFWSMWCPPCKQEMPDIEVVYQSTKKSDTVVLTINCDGATVNLVKKYMKDNFFNFTVLPDIKGNVEDLYGIVGIPKSIFIDKKGYIRAQYTGMLSKSDMDKYIKMLSNKK